MSKRLVLFAVLAAAAVLPTAALSKKQANHWWAPGDGGVLPASVSYDNPYGALTVLDAGGPMPTAGHPFFTAMGANGRACVSCHQPADGMSVSVASLRDRWAQTGGKDPVFAAVDGSNCPSLPQDKKSSHSLLIDHGLFRIFLPWPGKDESGRAVNPEFDIEVVKDPTGCNTDPVYGLKSKSPTISVFRRPRPVANTKFITTPDGAGYNVKTGLPFAKDPETGQFVSMQIMSDARELTLRTQAQGATNSHLEGGGLSKDQIDKIVAFESQVYAAQTASKAGGEFTSPGSPPGLGPVAILKARPALLGNDFKTPVFQSFAMWKQADPKKAPKGKEAAFRASVARGADLYMTKTIWIRDTTHLNTVGLGNPIKRSCSSCHNAQMSGMDVAPGWMDIGTNNQPTADKLNHLPLFKVTCKASARPHPFLGRVIYTHDPGRALISGKCLDVGSITMQQFRGLAARAPYFANGSAKDLNALIEYYNRRYGMKLTAGEKRDFVNFMSVL